MLCPFIPGLMMIPFVVKDIKVRLAGGMICRKGKKKN
jgi:hypothetical protein